LLERYLVRDGRKALIETLRKKNRLATAYGDVLLPKIPERLHKLSVLREIFDSHDFQKAVVFVDRLCIAQEIVDDFRDLDPVLFAGKAAIKQKDALTSTAGRKTNGSIMERPLGLRT
jgi:hypothetical protein